MAQPSTSSSVTPTSFSEISNHLSKVTIHSFLRHRDTISSAPLRPPQKMISLDRNVPLLSALDFMTRYNLHVLPLHESIGGGETLSSGSRVHIGLLTLNDILSYWGTLTDRKLQSSNKSMDPNSYNDTAFLRSLLPTVEELSIPIGQLLGQTAYSDTPIILTSTQPLSVLFKTLSNIHHVVVADSDELETEGGTLASITHERAVNDISSEFNLTIVSQTDLMAYVSTHRSVFSPLLSLLHRDVKFAALKSLPNYVEKPDIADLRGDTAEASLEDLPNVVSVSEDVTAFEAFRKMFEQDVSTVAITEKETGMLLENLSISDFRVLTKDTIGELMSPVRNYLDKVVGMNIPPVRVLDDSIVEDALLKMMASCIHHVWVVDSDDVPTGVISMSDIVSVIFEQESAERQEFVEE